MQSSYTPPGISIIELSLAAIIISSFSFFANSIIYLFISESLCFCYKKERLHSSSLLSLSLHTISSLKRRTIFAYQVRINNFQAFQKFHIQLFLEYTVTEAVLRYWLLCVLHYLLHFLYWVSAVHKYLHDFSHI